MTRSTVHNTYNAKVSKKTYAKNGRDDY